MSQTTLSQKGIQPITATGSMSARLLGDISADVSNIYTTVNTNSSNNWYSPYSFNISTSSINPRLVSNTASGRYSNIAGGQSNIASGGISNVGGGQENNASGCLSHIGGGFQNIASGYMSNVAGGCMLSACGNYSTVAGGRKNTASGCYSNIGGGCDNNATGYGSNVSGGAVNCTSGEFSIIGGGWCNCASACDSIIVGGTCNVASASASIVIGGWNNTASGYMSFIAGGAYNSTNGLSDTYILGTGLTATQANSLYTNNVISNGYVTGRAKPNIQTANTTYNITSSDSGNIIYTANVAGLTASLMPYQYNDGFEVTFIQLNTGRIVLSGGPTNIAINQANGYLKTTKQYSAATLVYVGTAWVLFGDLNS